MSTQLYKNKQKEKESKSPNKQLLKKIDEEIKQALKDCWSYHRNILQDADISKSNLINDLYDCELQEWEDVGYFIGYLRGMEEAKELITNNK